eukprot:TRINITY_DN90664_c0_g1_i1.p1 TRINITY_DN90664_c0_g1~~TRINITY_DN90664_c0_g1_i1.p1  ORF type:complete len:630 (-),score=155.50 TRINITY_DN90664_c0_g1_i1:56-1945(-)
MSLLGGGYGAGSAPTSPAQVGSSALQRQAIESLMNLLAQTQTTPSKDIHADTLFETMTFAEAALVRQPALEKDLLLHFTSSLCSWLRAHEDISDALCLRSLLNILVRLLGQDDATDSMAIQKGLLSSITSMLGSRSNDALLAKCCVEVLATLSVVESSDQILSRLGTVPLVIEVLRKHKDNTLLLQDSITTLALMAKRTRHRNALTQCSGIDVVIDILKRSLQQPNLVVAICRFVCNFSVKKELSQMVLKCGGLEALMVAFDSCTASATATDVRATIATTIWTCTSECSEAHASLMASHWMASLAAVLQGCPTHAGLHEAAIGVVRGVSKNAAYREDIINLGFVHVAIQAMRRFRDNTMLQKEACGFFGNLATDPAIRVQLGESGALEEVLNALSKCQGQDDRKVAKLALGALANLATCEANCEILSRLNSAATLLEAARSFLTNENVLEYAVNAISHMATHAACCRQLVEAGAVEALLLFLGEHCEDRDVVAKSVVALRRLLKHYTDGGEEAQLALAWQIASGGADDGGARGLGLIVQAMEAHVYDEGIAKETALLLTGLCRSPDILPALMEVALQPCLKAMEIHQNEVAATDALAGLLARLPLEEDDEFGKVSSANPQMLAMEGLRA